MSIIAIAAAVVTANTMIVAPSEQGKTFDYLAGKFYGSVMKTKEVCRNEPQYTIPSGFAERIRSTKATKEDIDFAAEVVTNIAWWLNEGGEYQYYKGYTDFLSTVGYNRLTSSKIMLLAFVEEMEASRDCKTAEKVGMSYMLEWGKINNPDHPENIEKAVEKVSAVTSDIQVLYTKAKMGQNGAFSTVAVGYLAGLDMRRAACSRGQAANVPDITKMKENSKPYNELNIGVLLAVTGSFNDHEMGGWSRGYLSGVIANAPEKDFRRELAVGFRMGSSDTCDDAKSFGIDNYKDKIQSPMLMETMMNGVAEVSEDEE